MSFFGKYYFASSLGMKIEPESAAHDLMRMNESGTGERWRPPTDVCESAEGYEVTMEIAGVDREDIVVEICGELLGVRGIRCCRKDRKGYLQMEIPRGRFSRQVSLRGPIEQSRCRAKLTNGILEIFIAKGNKTAKGEVRIPIS